MSLTPEQKTRIIGVISKDSEAAFYYRNGEGKTCVIGGLLEAAGEPLPTGIDNGESLATYLGGKLGPRLRFAGVVAALEKTYGLDLKTLDDLQTANDKAGDVATRRADLIKIIEAL
jgi:hypothetical protein